MHITWHGLTCIRIQTTEAVFLLNPFQQTAGVMMPRLKVDIAATTDCENPLTNNIDRLQGDPFLVTAPGEYEVKNVFIYGVIHPQYPAQTLFVIEAEGITLGHLGASPIAIQEKGLEHFEGVDVLFLPITGTTTASRAELVSIIEPRMIVPFHYKTQGMKVPLDPIEPFVKEMGIKNTTPEKKLLLKAKQLPAEETQVIILQATV